MKNSRDILLVNIPTELAHQISLLVNLGMFDPYCIHEIVDLTAFSKKFKEEPKLTILCLDSGESEFNLGLVKQFDLQNKNVLVIVDSEDIRYSTILADFSIPSFTLPIDLEDLEDIINVTLRS